MPDKLKWNNLKNEGEKKMEDKLERKLLPYLCESSGVNLVVSEGWSELVNSPNSILTCPDIILRFVFSLVSL